MLEDPVMQAQWLLYSKGIQSQGFDCIMADAFGFARKLNVGAGSQQRWLHSLEGDSLLRCRDDVEEAHNFVLSDPELGLEDASLGGSEGFNGCLYLLVHEAKKLLEVHGVPALVDLDNPFQLGHRNSKILNYIFYWGVAKQQTTRADFHLRLRIFESQLIIQLMGCTPPEKRHNSIPAVNVVPKKTHLPSPKFSEHSKNSTTANENNALQVPIPKLPSNESLKSKKKSSSSSAGNLQRLGSMGNAQRFSYQHQDSPQKPIEKEVIRIVSPSQKAKLPKKIAEKQELSKLTSFHSLDIVSKIKAPKQTVSKALRKDASEKDPKMSSKVEEVNITFNNNDFVIAQSKASGTFARGKRWKEEALINELKFMNNQNFKQISINSRNFN